VSENSRGTPLNWTVAPVHELFDVVGGGTPSTDVAEYWQGATPWISSADIDERHQITPRRCISEQAIKNSATNRVPAGSVIVVTRVGLGKVGIADTSICFSQDSQALIFNRDLLLPKYVLLYMGTAVQVFKHISRGTTISGVTKKQLRDLEFRLPPLPEQKRIVEEIDKQFTRLDAAVAALKRVRANLKRYRAAVLKAACEGRLVPTEAELARREGRSYEPASALLERILIERCPRWEAVARQKLRSPKVAADDNTLRAKYLEPASPDKSNLVQLPTGWEWARAEQLCDFITKGTTPAASKLFDDSGEVPYIKVYNLTNRGTLDFSMNPTFIARATHEGELARSRVFPDDVLMNIVGPPLGKVSIVPSTHPEWNVNQAIAIFRAMPSFNNKFLSYCLLTESVLTWAVRRSKATAGQFNLTLEICRDLPLPVPPANEQRRIVNELERRLSVLEELEMQTKLDLTRAERLRQSILKSAFEGKLAPQDPNDEPANVLLERVRADRNSAHKSAPTAPRGRRKKEAAHVS
jgi:type I restriction enzyme S subunit